jgi:hypothetical protein
MFLTNSQQQSGQSWTLDVHKDPATTETIVSCAACPEVGEVRDADERFAVQQMRRLLDDHTHRGYQPGRTPLMVGHGELLDEV